MNSSFASQVGKAEKAVSHFEDLYKNDFYKDSSNKTSYRAQVTRINGKLFVGITKMFDTKAGRQLYTKKNFFMPIEVYNEFQKELWNIDNTLSQCLTNLSMQILHE